MRATGQGCNHLTDHELGRLAARGFDPDELEGLDRFEEGISGDGIDKLCALGMPRYWTDEGVVLIHPREVLRWMLSHRETWGVAR